LRIETKTAKDLKIIAALCKYPTMIEASKNEKIPYSTMANWASHHKRAQVTARNYINWMLATRQRSKLLDKVLTPRMKVRVDADEEENRDPRTPHNIHT